MSTLDVLTISIDGPHQWPSLPPKDELNELSQFDFAMQRYLFDDNHRVLLGVGKFKRPLHFFPDIALELPYFPDLIWSLVRGEAINITFPESQLFLECAPQNGQLDCKVGTFGWECIEHQVILDATQTARELKRFLEDVFMCAVTAGYVSKEEADEIARKLPKI